MTFRDPEISTSSKEQKIQGWSQSTRNDGIRRTQPTLIKKSLNYKLIFIRAETMKRCMASMVTQVLN